MLFLVLFLFYSAYFMLRFSIEEGPRRANISAVYALFGVVLIPVSFLAIRLAERLHPPDRVHARRAADDRDDVLHVLRRRWLAMTLLAYTLYRLELLGKRARLQPARAPRGTAR